MTGPHLAFVTESGPRVGLGHLSRCLAIARAAIAEGGRASFLLAGEAPAPALWPDVAVRVERVPWAEDVAAAMAVLRRLEPDSIVVDSYAASPALYAALSPLGPVVAVDDLADRPLPVDVVVNGSIAAETLPYDRGSGAAFLLGARYALIDPEFAGDPSPRRGPIQRALICLGGSRQPAAARAAVHAASRSLGGCELGVVTGPFADESLETEIAGSLRGRVVFHRARLGLSRLMREADVAISGAGVTLYELAATATPSVMILVAPNQRPNFDAFARAGAAIPAGSADDADLAESVEAALGRLAADDELRRAVGARGRALVDGRGAARVVEAIRRSAVARR